MADLEPDKITNDEKDINNNKLIKENFSVNKIIEKPTTIIIANSLAFKKTPTYLLFKSGKFNPIEINNIDIVKYFKNLINLSGN